MNIIKSMKRNDVYAATAIGAAVGLLIQPILTNLSSFAILAHPTAALRLGIFVFFTLFAPLALWILFLFGKLVPVVYQFGKFAAVGTLNTFVDIGVFNLETFLYGTSAIGITLFAVFKALSFLCGTTNSFFWNKYWTFSSARATHPEGAIKETKEAVSFYIIAGVGWTLNVGCATFVKSVEPSGVAVNLWVNVVAPLAGVAAAFLWDFVGYKFFVFKEKK